MGKVIPIRQPEVSFGLMHVQRIDGHYRVVHESASGSSFGIFERFEERDEAVAYALRMLPRYAPCHLGEIAPCS